MEKTHYILGFILGLLSKNLIALDASKTLISAHQHLINYEYDQALSLYEKLAIENPNNCEILCNLGFMLKKQHKMIQAIQIYEKARPYAQSTSKIERALSGAYLALGDFERGWPAYEYRWAHPPSYNQDLKKYLEQGGSLHNKIVLIKTEYGLGDTLQFIRYAKILKEKGAYIIVESQKPLMKLLSLCPYIDKIIPSGQPEGSHFTVLLMSLPLVFGTNLKTIPAQIPYLWADQKLTDQWKSFLSTDKKFKIGICWQADVHKNAQEDTVKLDSIAKSIPLNYLAQLSQPVRHSPSDDDGLPNITLYSLQKVNGVEQLQTLRSDYKIHHFDNLDEEHGDSPMKSDDTSKDYPKTKTGPFMDTAAIIMNLDLIITIDTSIAHLAGGLGKPVWLLLPYAADWRWLLNRDDSPWYPTMTLFRQQQPGNWQIVMDEVKNKIGNNITF